jgi:uncharacterized protein YecE (DUF72 family)
VSGQIRIGCSGWNYPHWRGGAVYPKGCPPSRWLPTYAEWFDTVEVNATFYRLTKPHVVARWLEQTPEDFVFTLKGSRYLTHIRRLQEREQGLKRFYDSIEPIVGHPKMGPVLWQLPPDFQRDDERLKAWLDVLDTTPGRHTIEFRHATWYVDEVRDMLSAHDVALAIGDRPNLPKPPTYEPTTDFSFIRFHAGERGRRGNYSDTEIDEWAERIRALASSGDVFAYFNNDWEGFAVANGRRLRRLLGV